MNIRTIPTVPAKKYNNLIDWILSITASLIFIAMVGAIIGLWG